MPTVYPTHKVELSLTDPLTTPIWQDISDSVVQDGITVDRGRSSELDRFQAGHATIQLKNHDGRFDTTNSGTTRNLLSNPSVETDLTGWSAGPGTTVTRTNAAAFIGSWGVQVATTNVQFSGVEFDLPGNLKIEPGVQYTWSIYAALATAGSHAVTMYIDWYDKDGGLLLEDSNPLTLTSTTMTRFSMTRTAPEGAFEAFLQVETPVAGGIWTFYTDAWQFEPAASVSTYCDGTQSGCVWDGTAHASASHRGGSPYWPNLRPLNRVRIQAIWNAVTYPVFDGYVDGWGPEYFDLNGSVVNLALTDAFAVLAMPNINMVPAYTESNANNLLANPSFEDDATDYVVQNGTMAISTAQAYSGDQSLAIAVTNVALSGVTYDKDENIVVKGGNPYTFSLHTWCDTASRRDHVLRIRYYNSSGNQLGPTFVRAVRLRPRVWARYYIAAIAPTDADRAALSLMTLADAQGAYTVYTDAWSFEQAWTNVDALPEELEDERISDLLDIAGWSGTDRSITTGASRLLKQDNLPQTALLTYLQLIEQSVNGRLWMGKDGVLIYRTRWDLGQDPYLTSLATFAQNGTDPPYVRVTPVSDLTFVRNEIRLTGTQENTIEQVATDDVSVRHYGLRTKAETGLLVSDNELDAAADFELQRYKDARLRFTEVELSGLADPTTMWPLILSLEISRRITIKFKPPGRATEIVQECFIEGIHHTWTRRGAWTTVFNLSTYGIGQLIYPAGKGFFLLGTSALTTGSGVLVY